MNKNRKAYGPLDHAVMDVIDELRDGLSGRAIEKLSGLGHNRTAVILRRGTPPPTVGEVDALATGFGKLTSDVVEEAERRMGGSATVTRLHPDGPMSDPDAKVGRHEPIAARHDDDDVEGEAQADQT